MSSSFNVVNYNLRPSKAIQRALVFEGLQLLSNTLSLPKALYVGMGSVWFTDFMLAHKSLHIRDMISIECDEIGYKRAKFNRPFKTVDVKEGNTRDELPKLLSDGKMTSRPWVCWLDYDGSIGEGELEDIRRMIEKAPNNSILLITANARASNIADRPIDRPGIIQNLFEAVVSDELDKDSCSAKKFPITLSSLLHDYMMSIFSKSGRQGQCIRTFNIIYEDTSPMVTVGVVLSAGTSTSMIKDIVESPDWPALISMKIEAPHLTLREADKLQAELPRRQGLTRKSVQRMGFDLKDEQIKAFEKFYKYYPAYVEISW